MSAQEERFAQLYQVAERAARKVAPRHQGYVTFEDLRQDAVVWLLEHPGRIDHHTLPDGTLYLERLAGEVARHLARIARRAREAAGDLVPADRYHYSVRMVEIMLPAVLDPTWEPPAIAYDQPRSNADPAESGNFLALVADVRTAIEAVCSEEDRTILTRRSVDDWTWAQFGREGDRSGEWYRRRYWDILERLVAHLNDGLVLETDPDAEALLDTIEAVPPAPALAGDVEEDEWRLIGKDPYREPEYA